MVKELVEKVRTMEMACQRSTELEQAILDCEMSLQNINKSAKKRSDWLPVGCGLSESTPDNTGRASSNGGVTSRKIEEERNKNLLLI